jgi:hydrophobic/amphiphilic exporter-1 (mainly G- bacteria), HAE1 family
MAGRSLQSARQRLVEASKGISALCVRRPVLTIVVNMLIVIAGLAAYSGVEIRELPDVDRPVVTIRANYDGATPETVDKQVTSVLESAAARVPGVKSIASSSRSGRSRITVEFDESIDINVAANDLRDAIGNVQRRLPSDVDDLRIVKADDNSDAIMRVAVSADGMPVEELTRLVEDTIVDRLAAVDGVADVTVWGGREPLVRILIDHQALALRGISMADLETALRTVALDAPAGSLSSTEQSLLVRADASVASAEEVEAIRINPSTRVGDVADVIFGPADKTSTLRINGHTGVGLGIIRQAQSNTLSISEGVRGVVDELNATLPDAVSLRVSSDDATFIGGAIREVVTTLLIATAIVIGIIYLFLRSVPATLIPAITVPIALTGTVAAIWLAGFSINILTLLALVLATGIVVDDAIVVLENIERRRKEGMGPRAAAVLGARQVFFAVLATTATLAAVFIPISFFPGQAGRLFSEFGFVLAFAVMISSFVALTLCPMLASRLLGRHGARDTASHALVLRPVEWAGSGGEWLYRRLLNAALAAPMVVLVLVGLFAALAVVAFRTLPEELTPTEDRGIIPVFVSAPQGSTVDYLDAQMAEVEALTLPLRESGEATNVFLISGRGDGNSGFIVLTLAPWGERERSQQEIAAELNAELQKIPGVQVFARTPNSLGIRGGGQGLRFAVTGPDYASLSDEAEAMMAAMQDMAIFENVRLNYDTTQPQLSVQIDRERASDLGVSLEALGGILATLLDGREVGEYFVGEHAIPVRVEAPDGTIDDAADLENIFVQAEGGRMVPISSFVNVTEAAVAPELPREGQRRAVPLTATLALGVDLRRAMDTVEALAAERLPPSMGIHYLGEAATLNETSRGVGLIFAFAIVVVLLVLAAQFESFVSGVVIVFTVPFGLAAAVLALVLTGGSLNIYSQIGLVMLVGLMAKNGILIVEFANQLREQGYAVRDAIQEACRIRLRPVVMTMVSTVLGAVPLVLSSGAGAEARQALGWVVFGGLGMATVVTLFLTPVGYLLLAGFSKTRSAEAERLEDELTATLAPEEQVDDWAVAERRRAFRVAAE